MDRSQLPRRLPTRCDLEGLTLAGRQCHLRPGMLLLARQLWSATDGGCQFASQLANVGRHTLLIHGALLAEQHEVLAALERILPDLQIRTIDPRYLPVSDCLSLATLGGIWDHDTYLVPASALTGRSGKWLNQLVNDGTINDIIPLDWQPRLFGGGPNQVVLPVPWNLNDHVGSDLRAEHCPIEAWHEWAETHYVQEVLPSDIPLQDYATIHHHQPMQ